jgi:citrate synthase
MSQSTQKISTGIWHETPEANNRYATRVARCHGYDVFGQMLGNARWADMLYLLFRGEAPSPAQAGLLEQLALALANPGPRDAAVHAAMCGGVGGSTAAATLMAALAVGAGQNGGAREVYHAMSSWQVCQLDLLKWQARLSTEPSKRPDVWPELEHPPGFDPHGVSTTLPMLQMLEHFAGYDCGPHLGWLRQQRSTLEQAADLPLATTGVAAAVLHQLGFSPEQGEMLFLLLRLPGAAAHALEQWQNGYRNFPFYPLELTDDPAQQEAA